VAVLKLLSLHRVCSDRARPSVNSSEAPAFKGLHSLTSELNLRTFGKASLMLELNLSTFGTHARVNLAVWGTK